MKPENIDPTPEQQWDHLAWTPIAWHESGCLLKECAEIIGQRFMEGLRSKASETRGVNPISFGPVFQMLAGYAIESLLKGILVAREPNLVKDGKLSGQLASGHNLEGLFQRAGIKLTEPTQKFIRRLAGAVQSGRYPVTKTANKMERWKESSSTDLDRFLELHERLRTRLLDEMDRARGLPRPQAEDPL
jgi:hypothetical protein